jgi:hypothetical protein
MADFEITGCHANRAGQASVTLRDKASGVVVSIHHMPFEHDYEESVRAECGRIQRQAAGFAQAAIAFLGACPPGREVTSHAPGAAPDASDPPDAFGQPIPSRDGVGSVG